MNLTNEEQKIFDSRDEQYGTAKMGHENLGRIWASILSQHYKKTFPSIPAHIVSLMYAAGKICRISGGDNSYDSYLDARVYVYIAHQSQEEENKT